jgi:ribosomal protein S18 acetylase RimI-like enzyme
LSERTLPTPSPIDARDPATAARVVEIQQAAYAVEAELIGFAGIPPLRDTIEDVIAHDLRWLGVLAEGRLAAVIGYTVTDNRVDIDRLAVDPAYARRGMAAVLVRQATAGRRTTVSTGTTNAPATALYTSLGFTAVGRREITPGVEITNFEFVPQA